MSEIKIIYKDGHFDGRRFEDDAEAVKFYIDFQGGNDVEKIELSRIEQD